MTRTGRPRTKVCGVTQADDRDAVVAAGADAVGVIADVPVDTPRAVDRERAADLLAGVPPFVTGVLVTMTDTVEAAVDRVRAVEPDAVQVHDGLDPAELGALRRRVAVDVLAAVEPDPAVAAAYAEVADAVLVDSVDAEGAGGTGHTHDWERTREIVADMDAPVVLAGGLDPDNVAAAVATVRPFGVDVASGVEASGGVKDHDAVERFVEAARRGASSSSADPDRDREVSA